MENNNFISFYVGLPVIVLNNGKDSGQHQDILKDYLKEYVPFCAIFPISENGNPITKAINLLLTIYRAKVFSQTVMKNQALNCTRIGIYPSLKAPASIFELDSAAADYVYHQIFPTFRPGILRILKNLIIRKSGVHPSIGGIGVIVRSSQ